MVGRRVACMAAGLLACLWLCASPVLAAGSQPAQQTPGALHIEQVQAKLPELRAWFYSETEPVAEQLSARLGSEDLALEALQRTQAEDPVHYYLLVDCSTSTTAAQMQAVKTALAQFAENMQPGARVTLISFGVGVELLLTEESDPQAVKQAAETLQANQPGTLFFDAMAQAATLASAEEYALERKVMLAFSDSVDYNLGGYTQQEVESLLREAGLPLYAMGFATGNKAELDSFGALARSSGGSIYIADETNLSQSMADLETKLSSAWVASFLAAGNQAQAGVFHLEAGGQMAEKEVALRHHTPDTTAPTLVSAQQQGEDSILLTFSEPVGGAELPASYTLQSENGGLIGLAAAAYNNTAHTATLTLAQPPPAANIAVLCPGVYDLSAEANPVTGSVQLDFTGPPVSAAAPQQAEEGIPLAAWVLITLAGVGVLLAVAGAVVKKRGGLSVQEGKLHFGGQTPDRQEELPAESPGQLHFVQGGHRVMVWDVSNAAGAAKKTEIPIGGSLFVGRSDICEVVFDDPGMSRQHFVLEEKGEGLLLTNLSQSGGTMVNGVPVQNPRPLQEGDVVEAGGMRLVFRGFKTEVGYE